MRGYFELLKIRGARALLLSAFPARLAYSMIGLGTYFKVQQATHSISAAGLAVGLEGMSSALTAGLRGSIMDRWGLKWPLRTFVPAYAALILIFNLGHGRTELILIAFILGFTAPPINLSVRPMWKITVPPEMIRTAYAMDTSVMTSVGVVGPLLVTTLALSSHPASALNACAGFMILGGGALALLPSTKRWVPEKKVKGELPIWKIPGIRLLMIEGAFIGLGWGAFYIGVPAFATLQHVAHRTGLILAVMSTFTVIGGLLAGLISNRTSSLRAFRRLYLAWFIFSLPLAFTFPDWRLMTVVAFIGLVNGGLHVFYWEITEAVRPRGSAVAALGWLWTVEGTCAALGQAAGGFISQNYSPRWCLGATTIAISIGLVVINLGKGRLIAADRIPTKEADVEALGDVVSSEN